MPCQLIRSQLKLSEQLSLLEQDWLIGCLVARHGVRMAVFSEDDPCRLNLEYDADRLSSPDLRDIFWLCGLHAESVPAGALDRGAR